MNKKSILEQVAVVFTANASVIDQKLEDLHQDLKTIYKSNEKDPGYIKAKKSCDSIICGIRKNQEVLALIKAIANDDETFSQDSASKILDRLGFNKSNGKLIEVTKADVVERDLLDQVVIKKVDGVNHYYIHG